MSSHLLSPAVEASPSGGIFHWVHGRQTDSPVQSAHKVKAACFPLKRSWLPSPSTRASPAGRRPPPREKSWNVRNVLEPLAWPRTERPWKRRAMGAFSQPSQGHRGAHTRRHPSVLGSGLSLLEAFPGSQAGSESPRGLGPARGLERKQAELWKRERFGFEC